MNCHSWTNTINHFLWLLHFVILMGNLFSCHLISWWCLPKDLTVEILILEWRQIDVSKWKCNPWDNWVPLHAEKPLLYNNVCRLEDIYPLLMNNYVACHYVIAEKKFWLNVKNSWMPVQLYLISAKTRLQYVTI